MQDEDLTGSIVGAAMEVHSALGAGFQERTYENAMAVELALRGIEFERQVPIELLYKGVAVGSGKMDLLIENRLVVELKAVEALHDAHRDQVLAYLHASGHRLGLLVNFHGPNIKGSFRRVVAD